MWRAETAAVFLMALTAGGSASAQTEEPTSAAAWAGEARYWHDIETSNVSDYINLFDDRFIGWPCGQPEPVSRANLKVMTGLLPGGTFESKSTVVSTGLVMTYYRTIRRIQNKDGEIQTLVLNVTHTWIPTKDGWKIAGGMCRSAPPSK